MPYNLRKRKTVVESSPPQKKAKQTVAKDKPKAAPKVKRPKVEKVEEVKEEEEINIKHAEVEEKLVEIKKRGKPRAKATVVVKPETKAKVAVKKDDEKDDIAQEKDDQKATVVENEQLVFGDDTCGELGLGKIGISKKIPTIVPIEHSIKQVACGPMHTLSLTRDGHVYSYGCNDEGALGRITDGEEKLEATPTIVSMDSRVIKITAGDSHSAALTDKQEVFVWGNFRDEHGPIGLTPHQEGKSAFKPIQILKDIKFKDIASGSNHMLLLDIEGDVYSFGVGAQGQLGRLRMEDVGDTGNTKAITAENRDLFLTPKKVDFRNVDPQRTFVCDAIYAGNFSSFATNTDKKKNRLAGWGLNNYFQLGYKGTKGQLVQHTPRRSTFTCSTSMIGVACGPHHTIFLTKTGRVYSAGRAEYGMLGLGSVEKEVCPAKCIDSLGNSTVQVVAGINTSFAVSDDGKLHAWGMGGVNLGLQDDKDLKVPTLVSCLEDKNVIYVSTGSAFTSVLVK